MNTNPWRNRELDGKLLRFNRETGINALMEGEETVHFKQKAPRFLHVALTNACNKSCDFCYRPMDAKNQWTFEELMELAHMATDWGVLELTFGGGEPLVFPHFDELLKAIWTETPLCPSFTSNGLLITPEFLQKIKGFYGQMQLSIYDEDEPLKRIPMLAAAEARFGLNVMVTPARLRVLELEVYQWFQAGARDILLLSYKGEDPALHLSAAENRRLTESVLRLQKTFGESLIMKVDVCWSDRLAGLPQLLMEDDCGAGDEFLSITSDKRIQACSFHHESVAFGAISDIPQIYKELRGAKVPASSRGCSREGACT